MKKTLLLLSACLGITAAMAQTTVTLQASKDAAIGYDDGASPDGRNNNYGTAVQNAAFAIPGIDPSGLNVNRALIDFDLSTLPANSAISAAYLNLYATGPYGSLPGHEGNANASTLQRVVQSWQENAATWNNQPASSPLNQVTLSQSSSATQNYHVDVTALVTDMLANPSNSFGFKLQLANQAASNSLLFASKDHSNANLHPTLEITYRTGTVTGIPAENLSAALTTLYPNPSSGLFNVSGLLPGSSVVVLNALGQQVKSYAAESAASSISIDAHELPAGIYFCRSVNAAQKTITSKIVLQKN